MCGNIKQLLGLYLDPKKGANGMTFRACDGLPTAIGPTKMKTIRNAKHVK